VRRLRKNIEALGVSERARVIDTDIFRWFAAAAADKQTRADIVFFDPPYRMLTDRPADLQHLATAIATQHLQADGVVIFRHDAKDQLDLPGLKQRDKREYGGMAIEFLGLASEGLAHD
jgi:16S rRNA G966 N2-methylase RsmD